MAESANESGSGLGERLKLAVIGVLGAWWIRLTYWTARVHHHGDEALRDLEQGPDGLIIACWHRHLFLMRYCYRRKRMNTLISASKDGEIIARALKQLGIGAIRGSSSRGGSAALKILIAKLKAGEDGAITPDGPRGPVAKVKAGILSAAQLSGCPIVAVSAAARPAKILSTWDRFVLPFPFCRVDFVYGKPRIVARRADREQAALELEAELNALQAEAERLNRL